MPDFIVVCFYTFNTPYQYEAEALRASCEKHKIHCHIEGYKNRGSWVQNAAIKPEFVLKMMDLHPFHNIVYLDADARVRKYPELFESLDADIAVHYKGHQRELLSGTIFVNQNAKPLIKLWAAMQRKAPTTWDQKVLDQAIKKYRKPLKLFELPPNYCQIFDSMKYAGTAVIEHLQASRRYKQEVSIVSGPIPSVLYGVRIRRSYADGSYWITRPNKKVEAFLDQRCYRKPNTLRWVPKQMGATRLDDLRPLFKGKRCYIVGKGPSLDYLSELHFTDPDAPIIAINEAVHQVEKLDIVNPVFLLQQDAKLRDTCRPQRAGVIISTKAANFYADYPQTYIFQNTDLKLHPNSLSVSAAIMIAKRYGATEFGLVCFDACVDRTLGYADCVGYDSTWGGVPERFLKHRARIINHAAPCQIYWVIPKDPAGASGDKSQQ